MDCVQTAEGQRIEVSSVVQEILVQVDKVHVAQHSSGSGYRFGPMAAHCSDYFHTSQHTRYPLRARHQVLLQLSRLRLPHHQLDEG